VFSLAFLETAREVNGGEYPALECDVEGCAVRIVGEVKYALPGGALHLGDDSLSGLLKAWPETLAALIALGTSRVHCIKTGKVRIVTDPRKALLSFLSYYFRCRTILSPLMPDWAGDLLCKKSTDFKPKTQYPDPSVEWILPRLDPPSPEILPAEWSWLRETFSGLIEIY
jgi:hypothetical protein